MHIKNMNWMQVEAYLQNDDRCVLPLGSTEQHAYLSLSVDSILSEKLAIDTAEPLGIPVFPVLAYGITPAFSAFAGTISIKMTTYFAILEDILSGLTAQGFKRIVIVNGHGGNSPASNFAGEWASQQSGIRIKWHDWWKSTKTMKQVRKIDAVASHASWMENFPWTRLDGIDLPDEQKPMIDFNYFRQLSASEARDYLQDGNFGGVYQRSDEEMQKIWDVAIDETRALLTDGWVSESMRIVLIRPCCIGDVVMATATLSAVRTAYPDAHITFAVGGWSQQAINYHPAVDAILDTGASAMPVKSWSGFWQFVKQLRSGNFDLALSFVRSPLMSLALLLSGIPKRAGIDSNGRGFGYTHRYPVDRNIPEHEAQIYFNVAQQLGIDTEGYRVNLPILEEAHASLTSKLVAHGIQQPYIVINPAGGSNPGMLLDSKRWLPKNFALVANALANEYNTQIVLLAGPNDHAILNAVQEGLNIPTTIFAGELSFPEIGVLTHDALLYLGNDTGVTHLAGASGAKVAIVMGISDPQRYAPFIDDCLVLWKETDVTQSGVAHADNSTWDWQRDGISADDALKQIRQFLS